MGNAQVQCRCCIITLSHGHVNMYSRFKTVIILVDTLTRAVKKCIFNHTHKIKINWLTANLEGGINMGILAGS